MAQTMTFEEILAPISETVFSESYLGKAPVHIEGDGRKFHDVMNWDILSGLLGMSSIWSTSSLVLVMDKEGVPFAEYASVEPGRDGGQVLRPDPLKVQALLAQGATLVANDIDQLTPALRNFCRSMEQALGAKVQANLYLSSKKKQGFRVHFDTHDVFAVHVAGEKVWSVFQGRAQDPIAHAIFKDLPQSHHEEAKGELWRDVRLKPGDLLYLPRGQYHYALADDGPCCHIAFGATYPIGLDIVSSLMTMMVKEPICRANLPQHDDAALKLRMTEIAQAINKALSDPRVMNDIKAFQSGFSYPRHHYDLPSLIEDAQPRYVLNASRLKIIEHKGQFGLAKEGTNQAVALSAEIKDPVAWVLKQKDFEKKDLKNAFPILGEGVIDKLISDLLAMAVIKVDVLAHR